MLGASRVPQQFQLINISQFSSDLSRLVLSGGIAQTFMFDTAIKESSIADAVASGTSSLLL